MKGEHARHSLYFPMESTTPAQPANFSPQPVLEDQPFCQEAISIDDMAPVADKEDKELEKPVEAPEDKQEEHKEAPTAADSQEKAGVSQLKEGDPSQPKESNIS